MDINMHGHHDEHVANYGNDNDGWPGHSTVDGKVDGVGEADESIDDQDNVFRHLVVQEGVETGKWSTVMTCHLPRWWWWWETYWRGCEARWWPWGGSRCRGRRRSRRPASESCFVRPVVAPVTQLFADLAIFYEIYFFLLMIYATQDSWLVDWLIDRDDDDE